MALLPTPLHCVLQGLQMIPYTLEVSNGILFYGQKSGWKYKQTHIDIIVMFVQFVLFIYLTSRIHIKVDLNKLNNVF